MCNRSLKQTGMSPNSCEAEFYSASACEGELLGTRQTLQGTSLQRVSSSRNGFRLGKTRSTVQGTKRTQTHRNKMIGNTTVDARTFVG